MGNGRSRAGTQETVEHKVTGIGGDVQHSLDETLGLGGAKHIIWKQGNHFFLGVLGVANLFVRPESLRNHPLPHVG